jgi:tRNA threonylcarbamoyladenosine biosynthesis protein TsaB
MIVLGFDTSGEYGSIALRRDGSLLSDAPLHAPEGFAHVLFQHLGRTLEQNGCELSDVDCFAVASGPGSFTGVRVGLAAAKGLAEATGKPVAAISNLRALAAAGQTGLARAVILDARRNQVYAAVYDRELELVSPEVVINLSIWLRGLPPAPYEFIASASTAIQETLTASPFAAAPRTEAPRSLASAITLCADLDAAKGRLTSSLAADANYVRRSDAELLWRDK